MQAENPNFSNKQNEGGLIAVTILRPELHEILELYGKKQRFNDMGFSPEIIKGETVEAHIKRLLIIGKRLKIDEEIKNDCELLLGIHDLPEIAVLEEEGKVADTTAVEKDINPDLDKKIEEAEMKKAREIFNDKEFELYEQFSEASAFLKRKSKIEKIPTAKGLFCKVLDKIDADLKYHEFVKKDRNNWDNFGKESKCLSFKHYETFSTRLDLLRTNNNLASIVELCQNLLDEAMLSVIEMWKDVSLDEMPQDIRKGIDNFKIHNRYSARINLAELN